MRGKRVTEGGRALYPEEVRELLQNSRHSFLAIVIIIVPVAPTAGPETRDLGSFPLSD